MCSDRSNRPGRPLNSTPVLLPGESHGRRSLVGYSPWGRQESDTTERLHFHALEKEMATHSSILAWRIPVTEEPVGLPSMGSHRVGQTDATQQQQQQQAFEKISAFIEKRNKCCEQGDLITKRMTLLGFVLKSSTKKGRIGNGRKKMAKMLNFVAE